MLRKGTAGLKLTLTILASLLLALQWPGPYLVDRVRIRMAEPQDNGMIYAAEGVPFLTDYRHPSPIVFIGDSVTYGVKVPEHKTYPALVAEALGQPYMNLAVPGYDCLDVFRSLEVNNWKAHHPSLILYGYCINDFTVNSREFVEDAGLIRHTPRLSDLLHKALRGRTEGILSREIRVWQERGVRFILIPSRTKCEGWRERSLRMAQGLADLEVSLADDCFLDEYHLNERGHAEVARQIIRGYALAKEGD